MRLSVLLLALISLAGCGSNRDMAASMSARFVDAIPHWMGGMPPDAPPRPGTPEYDAWMAEREKEAARPKNGPKPN